MCGIFAIYGTDKVDKIRLDKSIKMMSHRGPNNSQSYINSGIALGHVRLSIIDLSKNGNQPFVSEDKRYFLTYNGEIFNYLELKSELESSGFSFETDTDTEVLLKSYIKWGNACVKKFNGMWAFVIYDSKTNRFFCSRDRFGIKPFYYTKFKNQILVSSEIKSILKYYPDLARPNYNVIANYCRTSIGAQHSETWFKDIFRLEPANNMIIDNCGYKFERYWDYPKKVDKNVSADKITKKYRNLFFDAVKIRLRSDVSVGITMSSGLDSTSIASSIKKINKKTKYNTYTAKFNSSNYSREEKQNYKEDIEIDESKIVKKLTDKLNMRSTLIKIDYNDYVKKLEDLIWHLESGHGSPAIYPLNQVMERAKKDVTVVLEGQGADELLGGYINVAIFPHIFDLISKFDFLTAFKELKLISKDYSLKVAFILFIRNLNINFINRLYFKFNGIDNLFKGKLKKYKQLKDYPNHANQIKNNLNKHLFKSHTGGLVNLLHYGDAISMKNSLESRLPFMDHRLVELAFKMPNELKIKDGQGKFVHRKAMQGIVPNFILKNKIKFGFDSPLTKTLYEKGDNSVKSIIFSKRCMDRELFDKDALIKLFDKSRTNKINTTRYIYRILCVELWFRIFIDKQN